MIHDIIVVSQFRHLYEFLRIHLGLYFNANEERKSRQIKGCSSQLSISAWRSVEKICFLMVVNKIINNYSPKWRWIVVDIYLTAADTEVNNCLSVYHASWITSGPKSNFICDNIPTKAILFFVGCSEVNSSWLITSKPISASGKYYSLVWYILMPDNPDSAFRRVYNVWRFKTLNEHQKNSLKYVIEKKKDVLLICQRIWKICCFLSLAADIARLVGAEGSQAEVHTIGTSLGLDIHVMVNWPLS